MRAPTVWLAAFFRCHQDTERLGARHGHIEAVQAVEEFHAAGGILRAGGGIIEARFELSKSVGKDIYGKDRPEIKISEGFLRARMKSVAEIHT